MSNTPMRTPMRTPMSCMTYINFVLEGDAGTKYSYASEPCSKCGDPSHRQIISVAGNGETTYGYCCLKCLRNSRIYIRPRPDVISATGPKKIPNTENPHLNSMVRMVRNC